MPDGLNKMTLIGVVASNPEMRYTANGNAITTFRVAATRSYMVESERRSSTEWCSVVTWNRLAEEMGQKLQQGQRVFVEGRLATRNWDGQDGQKHYATEVIASNVLSLGGATAANGDAPFDEADESLTDPAAAGSQNLPEGINRVQLIGNLGRDPEMRYTANGSAVSTFSVAVSRSYSDEGERKEETEWSRVVAFSRLGELVGQHLRKGRKVYVEGRLTTRSWDTPEGQKRFMTEVVADQVLFLDSRQGGGAPYSGSGGDIDLDDIPFEG
jgi:single-strand DNA-binding protein